MVRRFASVCALLPLGVMSVDCGGNVENEGPCGDRTASVTQECAQCPNTEEVPIDADPLPHVPCRAFEWFPAGSPECSCDVPGYAPATQLGETVYRAFFRKGACGDDACCGNACFCELRQYEGPDLQRCLNDANPPSLPKGWCYVDPPRGAGSVEALHLSSCAREFRLVTRYASSAVAIVCHASRS